MSIGQIREFNFKSGNWLAYIERMEMFFVANKISDDMKLPTLISMMGEETYELLSSLASPLKPSALKYQKAISLLQDHLQPKPAEMAERYIFRQRRQLAGESIAEYVAELKKLSRYCNFQTVLEDNLRDQFVCGLKSESTRQRLFAEENLDYSKAVSLATTLESAERDAGAVERNQFKSELSDGVNKLQLSGCSVCGDIKHNRMQCKYKEYQCSYCQQTGHLRRMCRKRIMNAPQSARHTTGAVETVSHYRREQTSRGGSALRSGSRRGRGRHGGLSRSQPPHAYWVQEAAGDGTCDVHGSCGLQQLVPAAAAQASRTHLTQEEETLEEDYEEPMFQMSLAKYKPVRMTMSVQNVQLDMEVDTGAPLSCISTKTYNKYFRNLAINPCCINLSFYDGSIVKPVGYIETEVRYNNLIKILDLYIFDNGTTNLLGRQWLAELSIDIPKLDMHCIKKWEHKDFKINEGVIL